METRGYYAPGDGGGGLYARVVSPPVGGVYAVSATGGIFALQTTGRANLRQFGAKGDSVTDDTAAIQAAVNSRCSLMVDRGTYRISSSVTFPTTNPMGGFRFEGSGRSGSDFLTSPRQGPTAAFVWAGEDGGTMFEMRSMVGAHWSGVALVGQATVNGPKAGKLISVAHAAGFGSGVHTFEDVDFQRATVGIQFGELATDLNCDTSFFNKCHFSNCDTGFLAVNNQALGFRFAQLFGTTCRRLVVMENGGDIVIDGCYVNGCGGAGVNDWVLDFQNLHNNSHSVMITGLRFENNTKQVLRAGINGKISINGANEAQVNQASRMFWTDGCSLSVDNFRFVTNDTTAPSFYTTKNVSGGFLATLKFSRGRFEASSFVQNDWIELGGPAAQSLLIRDCEYGATGIPLANVSNVVGWA